MSKRNNEGDVLSNLLAVGMAQEQSLWASAIVGGAQDLEPRSNEADAATEDDDLIFTGDYEQFGVGAAVPKEIENGTFTRRVPGSDDKLLQQLIGKKRAKAHLDAKHAKKNGATQLGQKPVKPQAPPKKEESEDEEEGRASAFKSKKRTITKSKPVALNDVATDDGTVDDQPAAIATPNASKGNDVQSEGDESDVDVRPKKVPKFGSQKSKPVSYLDQLLAEKSKKKKNKTKAKLEA